MNGTYGHVTIEAADGTRREVGLYYHEGATPAETLENILTVARLRFGAWNVSRVII